MEDTVLPTLRERPDVGDRAAGALLGLAVGDALGAPYEGGEADAGAVEMDGGRRPGAVPGRWTDDTSMAVCLAEVTATGALDPVAVGDRFLDWYREDAHGIGRLTRAVLSRARSGTDLAAIAEERARAEPGSAAGNGSLMRTAAVALARAGDDEAIVRDARAVSALTHADPLAQEACVLWCVAIDRALREERLDGVHDGLALLPDDRARWWAPRLEEAETADPATFVPNGFVVTALQAAHAAIRATPVPQDRPSAHLELALRAAIGIGDDTDTVAAIAGQVLGARWGASAVPFRWRRRLHGWPGLGAGELVRLALLTVNRGVPADDGWPLAPMLGGPRVAPEAFVAELPGDPGVLLGNLASLPQAAGRVDAVISLCRVGAREVPPEVEHHEVLLVDRADPTANRNLDAVLDDTVEALATLRGEGRRVFLHCAAGRSRAPTVAAAYLAARDGISGPEAFARVAEVVPNPDPHNEAFQRALARIVPVSRPTD